MNEEQIRRLLESLPRERASAGFTEKVMSRLDAARRPFYLQFRFAFAATVVLVIALWVGAGRWQAVLENNRTMERIATIKAEVEKLENDIRLLRDLAPVFYLGGDEEVDLVIDLRRFANSAREWEAQPISREGPKP